LMESFQHSGDISQIDNAVQLFEQAVGLAPRAHIDISATKLNNLGVALHLRFLHLGVLGDIESAIVATKQAVELTPDGNAGKPSWLNNLENAHKSRFSYLGDLSDIESVIVAIKQAVELTPDGHADKTAVLNNLGNAYESRFGHLGELGDIDSAIVAKKKAVELTPDGHADKPQVLNNLGTGLYLRFGHLGELGDVESAILTQKEAVELTHDGHHAKPGRLSNFGYELQFGYLGELGDIETAILIRTKAVELTPNGHADKAGLLDQLGNAYHLKFNQSEDPFDLDCALSAFQEASLQSSGKPHVQLQTAIKWSKLCSTPALAVEAYKRFFELIPRVAWLGKTVACRYQELPQIGRVIGAAAAAAISAGDLLLAIEWLDEGRNIVWGQILQLRSPLDDLRHQHPGISKELEMVSQALENAGTSTSNNFENTDSGSKQATAEEEAQKHRRFAAQYEGLISQVRSLDGFESFMRPKKYSELALAATHGPVITVNVDKIWCDALVVCSPQDIIHVPLTKFSLELAHKLHINLMSSLHANSVRTVRNGDRLSLVKSGANHDHFALILKSLWSNVVQPILSRIEDVVRFSILTSYVTWCATGPLTLLPLHAAGIYGGSVESNIDISDFVVSSYTATLRALTESIPKLKKYQAKLPTVLIVSQPETPGFSRLPGTVDEAEAIQKYTLSKYTCHLNHDAATSETVMRAIGNYNFIHFACHGIQDIQDPLNSAFALYDQRLKLKTLMGLSLNSVQLAFLSACQTATGDENLPEEAVHLAASMLAVGYPSVIASL
ncbi:hypothetical protein BT96DRAFT_1041257, partial [Gymnopus androsaceus JB14]